MVLRQHTCTVYTSCRDTVTTGGKTGLKQHSSKPFVILALARRTWAPAATGPGVSREPRFGRRRWEEGV